MTPIDARMSGLVASRRGVRRGGRGLGEIALERTAQAPDQIVVIQGECSLTRAEMMDLACRLGGALIERGVQPGAAIAIQLPNWWEACVINLTAALFGYRLVPLLTAYRRAELEAMLPACGVDVLFVPALLRKTDFPGLVAQLRTPPRLLFTLRGDPAELTAFERLLAHAPAAPAPAALHDVKMVIFTSGSTGRPKGVIHSHASINALITRTAACWCTGHEDVLYVASPIGHIGGSIYAFEFPWITGCRTILAESWNADEAVRYIDGQGVTFMAGATPFLSGLIEAADQAGSELPTLRRFICGGASVPTELVREGLRAFPNAVITRAYGSTEVPLVCPGVRNRTEAEAQAGTDGECTARVLLLDDEEGAVEPGGEGEIAVRAPQMFLGYLDPADEDGCFTSGGYFRMGDLGRLVDGRFLEITGRKKDIIIRKGENISPLEIENILVRHAAVRQSAVIGIPDPERGEMAVAFILPEAGATFTFADMIAHLEGAGLAVQKFPERLEIVFDLPLNSVGKVIKPDLKALLAVRMG